MLRITSQKIVMSQSGWFRCPQSPVRSFGGIIKSITCAVENRLNDIGQPTGEYRGIIYDTNTGQSLWTGEPMLTIDKAYTDAKKHRSPFLT